MENPVTTNRTAYDFDYSYDYMSRRVRKVSSDWQGGNWVQQTDQKFVYDGWNPVLELASGGELPASTAHDDDEREWLRTFPRLRQVLDCPAESGWCDSSTSFRAYETLEDYVLLATAHSWCDDCSWDKKWDCSYFYAIMRDGTFQGSFVEKDECLAAALQRMPELPQRVIRITFNGAGRGPSPDDGYSEGTYVASYRLDGEADWPGRLERILARKKKEPMEQ